MDDELLNTYAEREGSKSVIIWVEKSLKVSRSSLLHNYDYLSRWETPKIERHWGS